MAARARFPLSHVLRAVSLLVPARLRPDWMAEWRGEIEHAWLEASRRGEEGGRLRARLGVRVLGAVPDALWLRRRGGGGGGWLWTVRDATRSLRRRPGFALAVVATLALGMGSAVAIYTILDGLMLRPIPFHEPDRLVSVFGPGGGLTLDREALEVWRARDEVFSDLRVYSGKSYILTGAGEARSYVGWHVEPGFLEMLGVAPALGRSLGRGDAEPGSGRVVLLADEVWRDAFGRDPRVVGRTVELDGEPHRVAGVLPPALRVLPLGVVHLVLPLSDPPPGDRLPAMARLQSGLPLEAAQARLDQVSEILAQERPREQGWPVRLMAEARGLRSNVRSGFWTLGAAVLCLLMIACANAAGLLLLRGVSRRSELALRVALGSSRASLVRHVFAESLLLALAGGALGTLLAWGGVRGLLALMPSSLIRFSHTTVGVDARVLTFAFALTLLTGVVFGVLPAWRAAGTTAARAGRSATASRQEVRLRAALQVAQLALAVVLLAGAGLFGRSFLRLTSVPLGYEVDRILELRLVSLERLRGRDATVAFTRELDERLRALPGVLGVSRADIGTGLRFGYSLELEDGEVRQAGADILPHLSVDTAYFRVMGIPIIEGRAFASEDLVEGSPSVVVNRNMAAALWPGRSAIGRSLRIASDPWVTVVGVSGELKIDGPHDPYGSHLLFYPRDSEALRSGALMIRTAGDPASLMPAVRALVRELDPEQPIQRLETGHQALGETVADPRFLLVIMATFAAIAVTLAAIGVYALVAFTVAQRTREIGVRMALGARARRVVGEVVGWGLALGVIGVVIGLGAAVLLSRFVEALLFDVAPLDPVALALAGAVLLAACAAALVLPARRAAAVDPSRALREE